MIKYMIGFVFGLMVCFGIALISYINVVLELTNHF